MTLKLNGDGSVQRDGESPRDLQGVARAWIVLSQVTAAVLDGD